MFNSLSRICVSLIPISSLLLLASCQQKGILDPRGPVGRQEENIIINSAEVMAIIGIPTILLALYTAYWFRGSNTKAKYMPDFNFSGRLESSIWAISGIAVLVLSSFAWIGSFELDPGKELESENEAIEIDVVSLEWKWLFIYKGENIATINELVIPENTPVLFRLTSEDVMTSFFIPQLGSQIYTMSGMANRLYLEADGVGEYRGIAAHYNGTGFSDMHFQTYSVSQEDYQKFLTETKTDSDVLNQLTYDDLRVQSSEKPSRYGQVEDGLFSNIVFRKIPKLKKDYSEIK